MPVGHEIIGLKCNTDKDDDKEWITDLSFVLWSPPKDLTSFEEQAKVADDEWEIQLSIASHKRHRCCQAGFYLVPTITSLILAAILFAYGNIHGTLHLAQAALCSIPFLVH